jgi:uncharacterized protein YijF (DUF1287 family)
MLLGWGHHCVCHITPLCATLRKQKHVKTTSQILAWRLRHGYRQGLSHIGRISLSVHFLSTHRPSQGAQRFPVLFDWGWPLKNPS